MRLFSTGISMWIFWKKVITRDGMMLSYHFPMINLKQNRQGVLKFLEHLLIMFMIVSQVTLQTVVWWSKVWVITIWFLLQNVILLWRESQTGSVLNLMTILVSLNIILNEVSKETISQQFYVIEKWMTCLVHLVVSTALWLGI